MPADPVPASDAVTEPAPRFALVGHCTPDAFMLTSSLRSWFGDAEIHRINDESELPDVESPRTVYLVNRVLDGRFLTDVGLELIERLRGSTGANRPSRVMLISDLADAQAAAEAAGAAPGFGKKATGSQDSRNRLQAVIDGFSSA